LVAEHPNNATHRRRLAIGYQNNGDYRARSNPWPKPARQILALKPVIFRYKKKIDPAEALSFGLIAEDVAQVDPNLVTPDRNGNPETVRYEAINAMLLNEFLKEHKRIEEQNCTIQEQESTISELKKEMQVVVARLKSAGFQNSKSERANSDHERRTETGCEFSLNSWKRYQQKETKGNKEDYQTTILRSLRCLL